MEPRVRLTEEGETPSSKAIVLAETSDLNLVAILALRRLEILQPEEISLVLAEQVESQLRQRILTERAEMTV